MKRPARTSPANPNGAITIREVAAEAGVSTATVSCVLAGLDGVKEKVRERVNQAAAKLNYHPNRLARGLRLGHRKVIGVILPDLQNPFLTGVVHGVEAALYGAGYTLHIGHSDGLAEREQEQLRLLRGEGVAGLVFYQIQTEEPVNLEPLVDQAELTVRLRASLKPEIEHGILRGASDQQRARAAYAAICLDLAQSLREQNAREWADAIEALQRHRKVVGVLFFEAETSAGDQLRQRALVAGLKKPEKKVKIW
jgi:hypothetical protein